MDDASLDRLLSGDLSKLIALPKRVVRIFLSSTFTDMTLERNTLMERVYPRLKKYCRERFGLDFQVVDMRWGVRDEATDDHQTVDMCNREINTCQRVSLGPNFVALIGDKYGFRPLPNRIKSKEFRELRRCLIELDVATDALDTWYKEDLNARPHEHLLQPISSVLKNFTNRNEPDQQMLDQRIWQAIQERLHELLLIGSSRLVKQGRMTEKDQSLKYSISVTEREVIRGCLSVDDAKSHCLVYIRSIVDLKSRLEECLTANSSDTATLPPNQLSAEPRRRSSRNDSSSDISTGRRDSKTRKASLKIGDDSILLTTTTATTAAERRREQARKLMGRFVDLQVSSETGQWRLDEDAQAALNDLKNNKLVAKLSSLMDHNLKLFEVHWAEHDGLSAKRSDEHRHYLDGLTKHLYSQLTKMIRKSARIELDKAHINQGLVGEVLQHSHHANKVSSIVSGRSGELDMIRSYVVAGIGKQIQDGEKDADNGGDDKGSRCGLPMFIYGVDGTGKSSVLARAATLARDWILKAQGSSGERSWDCEPCIIMRFVGTTPASSSLIGVLTSVCDQLQYNFYQYGPLNAISNQREGALNSNSNIHITDLASSDNGPGDNNQLDEQVIPTDIVRLMFTFRQLLENCAHKLHRKRIFVIILDSLERLSTGPDCSLSVKYSWLTQLVSLPPNVRLIISCNAEDDGSSNKGDFLLLKRHFLMANLRYFRRKSESTSPADDDDAEIAHRRRRSSSLASHRSSLSSANSDPIHYNPVTERSYPRTEDKVDRYKRLKLLITPAVRLLRTRAQSSTTLSDNKSGSEVSPKRSAASRASLDCLLQRPDNLLTASESGRRKVDGFRLANLTANFSPEARLRGRWHKADRTRSSSNQQRINRRHYECWMLHIKPLGVDQALSVARHWLNEVKRDLTEQQWSLVRKSVSNCSRPIFVRLAFGEIVHWKSYTVQGTGDSKGLTFGSHLLYSSESKSNKLLEDIIMTGNPKLDAAIVLLKQQCNGRFMSAQSQLDETHLAELDNFQYQWHLLSMEQQWINYLDFIQRRHKISFENRPSLTRPPDDNSKHQQARQRATAGSTLTGGSGKSGTGSGAICFLSQTIEDAINQLFARLEFQHGQLLTKHSLSYITATRTGICENELEDVLSLDDVVLNDVFQYHLPPVRRIPPLLWTRIRNDLNDFLSERDADGVVIGWNHSQFRKAAEQRYLSDKHHTHYIHTNLADYFLGKWADKAKPFKCTRQQILMASEQQLTDKPANRDSPRSSREDHDSTMRFGRPSIARSRSGSGSSFRRSGASFSGRGRLRSSDQQDGGRLLMAQAKADRRVAAQPLQFETTTSDMNAPVVLYGSDNNNDKDDKNNNHVKWKRSTQAGDNASEASNQITRIHRRYNMRKLAEMPYHLMKSNRFVELANQVFFNYKWLYAQLDACTLQSLLIDLGEAQHNLARYLEDLEREEIKQSSRSSAQADKLGELDSTQQQDDIYREESIDVTVERLDTAAVRLMMQQLSILESTLRLSSSTIQSDLNMLAPQLIGRLLPVVRETANIARDAAGPYLPSSINLSSASCFNPLPQLLKQCDRDGSAHCGLLPLNHVLQSPGGLQSSSLEGHPFGVMCMARAAEVDGRHLLAVSNKFIMWDIGTGEIVREIDPLIEGSIMKKVCISSNGRYAVAHTSDDAVIVLDVHTQHVVKLDKTQMSQWIRQIEPSQSERATATGILGLDLIGSARQRNAKRFVVWTCSSIFILRINSEEIAAVDCASGRSTRRSKSEPIRVDLDYLIDSDSMGFNYGRIVDVKLIPGDLILILFNESGQSDDHSASNLMNMVTFVHNNNSGDSASFDEWSQRIDCTAINWDCHATQLIFSDLQGNIWLSRRRKTCWSRWKLLADAKELISKPAAGSQVNERAIAAYVPFSIELTANSASPGGLSSENLDEIDQLDPAEREELLGFERQVDNLTSLDGVEGIEIPSVLSGKEIDLKQLDRSRIKYAQLHYQNEIVVLFMCRSQQQSSYSRQHLALPQNICNVCIEVNMSQIKSVVMSTYGQCDYLIASYNRILLFYNLENGTLTRTVEAHSGRINQILCLDGSARASVAKVAESRHAAATVATASMDRSVKLWNLDNIEKDSHDIESSGQAIEHLSVANNSESTIAACIEINELIIWDWSEGTIVHRMDIDSVLEQAAYKSDNNPIKPNRNYFKDRLVRCCFSSNSRYLVIATLNFIQTFALDIITRKVSSPIGTPTAEGGRSLRKLHKKAFVARNCLARKIWFVGQDLRILVVLESDCKSTRKPSKLQQQQQSSCGPGRCGWDSDLHQHMQYLLIECYSVPDLREQVYSIDSHTPVLRAAHQQESRYMSAKGQTATTASVRSNFSGRRSESKPNYRLPILTFDQLNLVIAEFDENYLKEQAAKSSDGEGPLSVTARRRYSSLVQTPMVLKIYSTRDGQLLRTINLTKLNLKEIRNEPADGQLSDSNRYLPNLIERRINTIAQATNNAITITNNQFTCMKRAKYQNCSTVIGLIDDRGQSYLIDVLSGHLVNVSNLWSGKLSSDGRFGLSRVFKSSASLSAKSSNELVSRDLSGLHLIEMRRFKSLKILLTETELGRLLMDSHTIGSESHLKYGFTRPNDQYVYLYDSRVKRLLLVRLRDNFLIANYKLPLAVTKIRCSPDGYTIILAHTNGTLTCLAIVDPQTNDTLTKLSQFPSRQLWKNAK